MVKKSNGIGAGGSLSTSSTKEEAFSHASVERVGTAVSDCSEFLSGNATAEVRSGTAPSCAWALRYTSSAELAAFRLCNRAIFNDCSENLNAAYAVRVTILFLIKNRLGFTPAIK